jgi:hypothetical protein
VPDVVRDNAVRATGHGQFEKKLVAWVRKEWPEPEVDVRLATRKTEGLHDGLDSGRRKPQTFGLTFSTASYSRMRGTEIKGTQLSPIRRKMAKDAPRRDRSAEMTTLVSKTMEYM